MRTSREDEAFRRELQDWVAANLPEEWKATAIRHLVEADQRVIRNAWLEKLGEAGWLVVGWPVQYGGRGATAMQSAIYYQELRRADAPDVGSGGFLGPTIMEVGTEEQKAQHVPGIARGTTRWLQGFSEPNAGSDLAGLQTKAVRDGDEWVVNGQKIWNGGGVHADWLYALVRTDPDVPKHRGISFLLMPVKTAGVTVRPIKQINEEAHFAEIFFDDARVPIGNVLGPVNEGWRIANRLLTYERGALTISMVETWERWWRDLRDYAASHTRGGRRLIDDERIRQRFAELYCEIEVIRLQNYRHLTWRERGRVPAEETSYLKASWVILEQGFGDLSMQLGVLDSMEMPGSANAVGEWTSKYLYSRVATVYGGTQDIQRNIIAERLWGLPR